MAKAKDERVTVRAADGTEQRMTRADAEAQGLTVVEEEAPAEPAAAEEPADPATGTEPE
jgi:hypothetical protein